ncbi:MAG: DUF3164 family protein [Parvibaculum sp.]|uniref:DUF3164 family protein n=1 Tax=Parvibaculum sp. TaxID=2024848 RepID=UPI00271FE606|nr:DUF3164 family protein [Parvibaculum sp.]MDO8837987.1 DUF3164 family protein [Parvibaculum sp.]
MSNDFEDENAVAGDHSAMHGVKLVNGEPHMTDAKGRLTPLSLVKAQDQLRDHMVRKLVFHADALNAQIARFRAHCFDDINSFIDLLKQEYGVVEGGSAKGNMTFTSYDGCLQVKVAIADQIVFGAELQVAKQLIDACIVEWSAGSNDHIRALVDHAFEPQKEGQVNREALFRLRQLDIDDPRWRRAVDAINDAIRVVGSKQYIRFYRRASPEDQFEHLSIDLAKAKLPAKAEA